VSHSENADGGAASRTWNPTSTPLEPFQLPRKILPIRLNGTASSAQFLLFDIGHENGVVTRYRSGLTRDASNSEGHGDQPNGLPRRSCLSGIFPRKMIGSVFRTDRGSAKPLILQTQCPTVYLTNSARSSLSLGVAEATLLTNSHSSISCWKG
jgi:hypothetical protein